MLQTGVSWIASETASIKHVSARDANLAEEHSTAGY